MRKYTMHVHTAYAHTVIPCNLVSDNGGHDMNLASTLHEHINKECTRTKSVMVA